MKNSPSFEKIIGGTLEEQDIIRNEFAELFEGEERKIAQYERKKSRYEIQVIHRTQIGVKEIVQEFKGNAKELPLRKIHIVAEGAVRKLSNDRFLRAMYFWASSDIAIERRESGLETAVAIAHELFHLQSPKVLRIGKDESADLYRAGIIMIDHKHRGALQKPITYFGILEEAIVAEATKIFLERVKTDPLFRREAEAIDRIKRWVISFYQQYSLPDAHIQHITDEVTFIPGAERIVRDAMRYSDSEETRRDFATGVFDRLVADHKIEVYDRYTERQRLYELLDEVVQKSKGEFKSRQEVFRAFAEANFTGRYLPIARILERTIGKDNRKSVLRGLAEDFSH